MRSSIAPLDRRGPAAIETAARILLPLTASLAIAAHAALGPAGDGRAEGLFLARLAAGVLAASAALAPQPRWVGGAAALVVVASWILPPGPQRAAVVTALLVATLALAAWSRWHRLGADGEALDLGFTLPLFLGAQFLLRSPLLLPAMNARSLIALFALPAAGAVATSLLARRLGARGLIAGLVAASLAPGFNVAVTLALVALAAGLWIYGPSRPAWQRGAAAVVLLAPLAWDWRAGLIAALCAGALAFRETRGKVGWAVSVGLGIVGLVVAVAIPAAETAASAFETAALVAALLPCVLIAGLGLRPLAFAALLLAAAAGHTSAGAAALTAPFALGALSMLESSPGRNWERIVASGQLAWSGALLALVATLATYPWLRHDALGVALHALGLVRHPEIPTLLLVLALASYRSPVAARGVAWTTLVLASVTWAFPNVGSSKELTAGTEAVVLLDAEHPQWSTQVEPRATPGTATTTVRLESTLLNTATLPTGTAVAAIQVEFADGSRRSLTVRSGEHTGEWAAERPDLKQANRAMAPGAWVSWVADGPVPFFGRRYRAEWSLPSASSLRAVALARDPTLPSPVALQIYGLELRP